MKTTSSAVSDNTFVHNLFSEELLHNIKLREYILGGMFLILIFFMLINLFFISESTSDPVAMRSSFIGLLILLVFLIIRSFIVRKILEKKEKQVKKYIWSLRFINAGFEAAVPTIAIILLTFFIEPLAALNSPVVFLYLIFIFITILDLDFRVCALTGLVSSVGYFCISFYFLDTFKSATYLDIFVLPVVYIAKSAILLFSGFAAGAIANHIKKKIIVSFETIQERYQLEKVFGQQVSKEIVDEFLNNQMKIDNRIRNVSIMFLDIRNFSKYCEGKSPEEINQYQNKVLGFMIDTVNKNGGIVNQILGDGFMATFGAPIQHDNHALSAINAAIEIRKTLITKINSKEIPETKFGIGIHSGEVVTGNVGTEERKQYSVVGNTVNLAARLEQLTKELDSDIILSKAVVDNFESNEYKFKSLGEFSVKGYIKHVEVYKLV